MKVWPGTNIECILSIDTGGSTIDIPTFKCLEAIFSRILLVAMSLALLALFVMLVIGGFKYLTSGGDPKATAAGQQTMTFAFAGIILMALAYVIFLIIKTFTGVDVLNFTIPAINYTP